MIFSKQSEGESLRINYFMVNLLVEVLDRYLVSFAPVLAPRQMVALYSGTVVFL